jgi:hypothetical protein
MRIEDLTHILNEYYKHFGSTVMSKYFEDIIKIKNNKKGEKTNASSKKTS